MEREIRDKLQYRTSRQHIFAPEDFKVRGSISARSDSLIGVTSVSALLIFWCVATYGGLISPSLLPSPKGMLNGLLYFHQNKLLFPAIAYSFLRVGVALTLVVIIGIPVGVLMGAFAQADALLRKIVNGAKSVPAAGGIALVILWFNSPERGKIAFLFFMAIFYMIIQVKNAIINVDEKYLRMAINFGATRWQQIARTLIPGALPRIWDAITDCAGIIWSSVIVVEFIQHSKEPPSLGYLLYFGSSSYSSGQVFATLLVFAVVASATDFVLLFLRKKYLNW